MKLLITREVSLPWVCYNCCQSADIKLSPTVWIGSLAIGGKIETIQCACGYKTDVVQLALASLGLVEEKNII